jgi:UDP-N-acetylmuramate dehydrogenase
MAVLKEQVSLQKYNTFGINVTCRYFLAFTDPRDVQLYFDFQPVPTSSFLILGEGSNVLFTQNVPGTVLHPAIKGIKILEEHRDEVVVHAGAGENWDGFVEHAVRRGWSGIENLSYIPGTVGAAPVQNIGAYGAEAKDVIVSVEGYNLQHRKMQVFSHAECAFEYRTSVFKSSLAGVFLITGVTFRLNKGKYAINAGYGSLAKELEQFAQKDIAAVRQAVISIRKQKLPDPRNLGNAGSFFKNPVISKERYESLKTGYPDLPCYELPDGARKVPAAWLIDQCGWKGIRKGDAGVHKHQPLVLVNYGNATGNDLLQLANEIQHSVFQTFTIRLEMEVNVL